MAESLWQKAGNGLMFNISWLAIVSSESAWVALPVVLVHLAIHQLWLVRGWREPLFILAVSVFGVLLDQFLFAIGLFTLAGEAAYAPLWLSCLWPVLATTFNHAFSALQRSPLLAAVLGASGGLGSYYAGTAMSAVGFGDPVAGLVAISLLWAVLFPALSLAARVTLTEVHGETRLV